MEDTLFTRFLTALQVPHTQSYSDAQFEGMTFKSLFGLSHLLLDYHVPNEAYEISDKSEFAKLTPPFLAQTADGVVDIVKAINHDAATVTFDSNGKVMTKPLDDFIKYWNGVVLLAYPCADSCESDWKCHRLQEIVAASTRWILLAAILLAVVYFFVTRGLWRQVSTTLIFLLDCGGIYLSYLLMLKNIGVKTSAGDRVCGVLQKGGCDDIMSMKVSKLFGVISWSEVGLGYFSVSLLTLLLFPHLDGALALFNACCLPYTVWSITYQKFVAKRWCTLCVGVQTTLWLLFFCYLGGGMFRMAFPLQFDYLVLIAVYVGSVMSLNLFANFVRKQRQ